MGTPLDVIGDMPDKIRAKIPSKEGKYIFMSAYNSAYENGASVEVSFARGWVALTVAGYIADESGEWRPLSEQQEVVVEDVEFSFDADVTKLDEDQRLVYGWASIVEEDGQIVVDKQGDIISPDELLQAAHDYMSESREAHEMHEGVVKGRTVESIVFTEDVQKALGIDLGKVGWFICQKIEDDKTWEMFKSGELKSFSIGGRAIPVPVD